MINLLVASILVLGVPNGVRVERLDGPVAVGAIQSLRDEGLILTTEHGDVSIQSDQLFLVHFGDGITTPTPWAATWVELRDGSQLPVAAFTIKNKVATLELPEAMNHPPISVPITQLAAVRFQPPSPKTDTEWKTLRASAPVADLLVIRHEESVDHVAGLLGDIDENVIHFEVDGESIPVPREKVYGLLYYQRESHIRKVPLCTVIARDETRLAATRLILIDAILSVCTESGLDISLPLSQIHHLDYSAGKLVYLLDLTPRSSQSSPFIDMPPGAELLRDAEGPIFDRGFFTAKPILRFRSQEQQRAKWEAASYDRSIGMRSRSELTYRLPEGFRRLQAHVGIDAELGDRGAARLIVQGDDKTLFDEEIEGRQGAMALDLDIDKVRYLKFLVDYGAEGDIGDRIYLCDPRIIK
ncbi:MAG: NPCBM/NEW2 domain-containing protein [Pirellulales bacterium]|nr:NPCBM/NEW2 domain-containing protein [Pirellulales bacterium]